MIPLLQSLFQKNDIGMSRPWDLTEKIPFYETWGVRIFTILLGFLLLMLVLTGWIG